MAVSTYIEDEEIKSASKLKEKIDELTKSAKQFKDKTEILTKAAGNLKSVVAKLGIASVVKTSLKAVNEYQSAFYKLNKLMGEGAKDAQDFANSLQDALGINPAQWLSYQSIFYQSATGMGIMSDKAQIMSKTLTQLSYDMAAFNGEQSNVQKYASKLNEAYTGSIKSLRNMGFALGEADLREEALLEGIDVNIRTLNAASKSMLRYNAIIRQSKNIQNSYVQASISLAGAQGILDAQLKTLYQTLGGLIYPMAMTIMPYLIGFVKLLTTLVSSIASALNIEMPVIDTKASQINMNALEDDVEGVGKAMKESFTLGIDELNVFSKTAAGVSGIGGTDITNLIQPETYDFLAGYEGSNAQKFFEGIAEKVEELTPLFEGFATVIAFMLEILKNFGEEKLYPFLVKVSDWIKDHPEAFNIIGKGIAIIALVLMTLKLAPLKKLIGFMIDLATNTDTARQKFAKLASGILIVWGVVKILKGAFDTVVAVMNIINGKGDFLDNVKLACQGLAEILTGVVLVELGKVILKLGTTGAVGEAAFLGIGVVAGLVLIDLIKNWDERSYQIQQGFGNLMLSLSKGILKFKNGVKDNFGSDLLKFIGNFIKTIAEMFYELYNGPILLVLRAYDLVKGTNHADRYKNETFGKFSDKIDDIFNIRSQEGSSGREHGGRGMGFEEEDNYTKFWTAYLGASQYDYEQKQQEKIAENQKETTDEIKNLQNDINDTKKELGIDVTQLADLNKEQINKLDKIKTACENFKINIVNNYGGGEYAGGGYPTTGEVFFARERGPELVGRIGNRTAVMNNEQIYEGMYRTVMAAIQQGGASQPVEVTSILELDGETVYRNQKKVEARKGFSMGGGVFAHI